MKYNQIQRLLNGGRDDQVNDFSAVLAGKMQDLSMRYAYQRTAAFAIPEYAAAATVTEAQVREASEHFDTINSAHMDLLTLIQYSEEERERINCKKAGLPGHYNCGICPRHFWPRFKCGCLEGLKR